MDKQSTGILLLIRSALTKQAYALPQGFDFPAAIKTARAHQVSEMLYYGALNCGISRNNENMKALFRSVCAAVYRDQRQQSRIQAIFEAFQAGGINYMPLKGTVLKALYPAPEMRTMSDADILISLDNYETKTKTIMEQLGFTASVESDHELVWRDRKLCVELHKRIVPSYNKDFYGYYGDGWRFAKPVDGHRYAMNPEDEFVYLFTHLSKHYRDGGIGIKHFTDLWVYRQKHTDLEWDYIHNELEKLELDRFYRNIETVLGVWFEGREPDEMAEFITTYVMRSGAYGTHEAGVVAAGVKQMQIGGGNAKRTRGRVFAKRVFLPYDGMTMKYPVLKKWPILLPVFWVVRWFDALLHKRQNISRVNKELSYLTTENIQSFDEALKYVGLTFHFEE